MTHGALICWEIDVQIPEYVAFAVILVDSPDAQHERPTPITGERLISRLTLVSDSAQGEQDATLDLG